MGDGVADRAGATVGVEPELHPRFDGAEHGDRQGRRPRQGEPFQQHRHHPPDRGCDGLVSGGQRLSGPHPGAGDGLPGRHGDGRRARPQRCTGRAGCGGGAADGPGGHPRLWCGGGGVERDGDPAHRQGVGDGVADRAGPAFGVELELHPGPDGAEYGDREGERGRQGEPVQQHWFDASDRRCDGLVPHGFLSAADVPGPACRYPRRCGHSRRAGPQGCRGRWHEHRRGRDRPGRHPRHRGGGGGAQRHRHRAHRERLGYGLAHRGVAPAGVKPELHPWPVGTEHGHRESRRRRRGQPVQQHRIDASDRRRARLDPGLPARAHLRGRPHPCSRSGVLTRRCRRRRQRAVDADHPGVTSRG